MSTTDHEQEANSGSSLSNLQSFPCAGDHWQKNSSTFSTWLPPEMETRGLTIDSSVYSSTIVSRFRNFWVKWQPLEDRMWNRQSGAVSCSIWTKKRMERKRRAWQRCLVTLIVNIFWGGSSVSRSAWSGSPYCNGCRQLNLHAITSSAGFARQLPSTGSGKDMIHILLRNHYVWSSHNPFCFGADLITLKWFN